MFFINVLTVIQLKFLTIKSTTGDSQTRKRELMTFLKFNHMETIRP